MNSVLFATPSRINLQRRSPAAVLIPPLERKNNRSPSFLQSFTMPLIADRIIPDPRNNMKEKDG